VSDAQRRQQLGQVVLISGGVRAASSLWELELQRALLEDGAPLPGDDARLDRLCASFGLAGAAASLPAAESADERRGQSGRRELRNALRSAAFAAAVLLSLGALALAVQAVVAAGDDSFPSRVEATATHGSVPPRRAPARRWHDTRPLPLLTAPPLPASSLPRETLGQSLQALPLRDKVPSLPNSCFSSITGTSKPKNDSSPP
jgi:hypothetical protein